MLNVLAGEIDAVLSDCVIFAKTLLGDMDALSIRSLSFLKPLDDVSAAVMPLARFRTNVLVAEMEAVLRASVIFANRLAGEIDAVRLTRCKMLPSSDPALVSVAVMPLTVLRANALAGAIVAACSDDIAFCIPPDSLNVAVSVTRWTIILAIDAELVSVASIPFAIIFVNGEPVGEIKAECRLEVARFIAALGASVAVRYHSVSRWKPPELLIIAARLLRSEKSSNPLLVSVALMLLAIERASAPAGDMLAAAKAFLIAFVRFDWPELVTVAVENLSTATSCVGT